MLSLIFKMQPLSSFPNFGELLDSMFLGSNIELQLQFFPQFLIASFKGNDNLLKRFLKVLEISARLVLIQSCIAEDTLKTHAAVQNRGRN